MPSSNVYLLQDMQSISIRVITAVACPVGKQEERDVPGRVHGKVLWRQLKREEMKMALRNS
jgi:hypothetical protein